MLAFMVLFTAWTVVAREFFDQPILGVVDVMELALVLCVFLAIGAVFLRDDQITVDLIDRALPPRAVQTLRLLAWLVALLVLCASLYGMIPAALEKYQSTEVTMTLSIARYIHWIPILIGFVVAIGASLWLLIERPADTDQ